MNKRTTSDSFFHFTGLKSWQLTYHKSLYKQYVTGQLDKIDEKLLNLKFENFNTEDEYLENEEYSHFLNIIKLGIKVSFNHELVLNTNEIESSRVNKVESYKNYPIASFCEIPLTRIENHTNNYGLYGIGLKRSWKEKYKLSPVIYVEKESSINKAFHELEEDQAKEIYPYLKMIGSTERYNKGDNEWRYVHKELFCDAWHKDITLFLKLDYLILKFYNNFKKSNDDYKYTDADKEKLGLFIENIRKKLFESDNYTMTLIDILPQIAEKQYDIYKKLKKKIITNSAQLYHYYAFSNFIRLILDIQLSNHNLQNPKLKGCLDFGYYLSFELDDLNHIIFKNNLHKSRFLNDLYSLKIDSIGGKKINKEEILIISTILASKTVSLEDIMNDF